MRTPAQIAATDKMKALFHRQSMLLVAKAIGRRRVRAKWRREHFDEYDRLRARQSAEKRRAA